MFPPNIWGCKFTDNSSIYKASSKQICQIYEWHTLTTQQTYESNNRCDSTIAIRADAVVLLYQRVGGGPAVRGDHCMCGSTGLVNH